MPEYSAGSASIRIRPNADHFIRELRAKLSAIKDPGFTIAVNADTGQAAADIRRFREVQARNGLKIGVDVGLAQAQADLKAFRAREAADGIVVRVDADIDRARGRLNALRREMGDVSGLGSALRLNLGAGALAGVQPAAAGLAQLAAGLQQVAQAGIAVPGAIAAAGASIGTLVLGLSGIKEAWDAASTAAEGSGRTQADQARAAASASNNLRNSLVDEAQARKDVVRATRDAQQALQDLRIEQRGGMLDESRAILEAQKAREDLARGNYSDVRDAALRVAEADQRVLEVRNRNAQTADRLREANEKGVAGSDQVVAANERLVRSQQQVADAQAAVSDATSKTSAAQQKADELMSKLSGNQREMVQTLLDLKPAFQSVRDAAAEPLLAGTAAEFRDFFTSIQPNLEAGVGSIARSLNDNISTLLGSLGDDEGKGILDRILGNTAEAQANFSAAIDPLVKGIGTLAAAGTDAMPRVANGFAAVSDRFRNFITEADQDGRLDKWINDGIDGLTNLGNTVLNIGKAFAAITNASGGGRSFTEWLKDATGRLQTFLNSAEGQNKLREYFAEGKAMLEAITPLLKELPGAFQAIAEGAGTYIGGAVLPILTQLAQLMGDHPALVQTAIAAYLGFKTIQPIAQTIMGSFTMLSGGLTALGTGFYETREKAKAAMGDVDTVFKNAHKEGSGLKGFARATSALGAVGGPIGILAATAIPGLIVALGNLDTKSKESAQVTKDLQTAQENLEQTVDRVTGKLTAQSRSSLINQAQNFDTTGQPGGGVPGISSGDALAAAVKLGIPPDLYADALEGKKDAVDKVRSILIRNNVVPEIGANDRLSQTARELNNLSGGKIDTEFLARALVGVPGAPEEYEKRLQEALSTIPDDATRQAMKGQYSLLDIAEQFGPGRNALLAGRALTFFNDSLAGVGTPTQQANQAQYGRFRVKGGVASPFAPGTEVQSSGSDYQIVVPGSMAEKLRGAGIEFTTNSDGTLTAKVPLNAPYIEKYKQGSRGRTPGGRNQGFLAELHGQEWVHDARTVDRYGTDVMNAMWKGQLDPELVRGLLPKFQQGGPTDPNDPNYVGIATGQTTGGMLPGPTSPPPVAPNTAGGGIDSVVNHFVSGMQGPLNNALAVGNALQQQGGAGQGTDPGWGPGGAPIGLGGGPMGPNGEAPFDIRSLGIGPGPVGSGPNDWLAFAGKELGAFGSNLVSTLATGLLDAVGLGGIMGGTYMQAASQVATHFGTALQGQQQMQNLPSGTGTLSTDQLSALYGLGPLGANITPQQLAALFSGGAVDLSGVAPGRLTSLPTRLGGESGLQINTINVKRAIEAAFPEITSIGGVRKDALKWHPNGLAIDVMIPGAGGLNDPTPPEGKALGDRIYQWVMDRKDQFGVDYIMWQEKDHYNHLHINTTGGGYPQFLTGGHTPGAPHQAIPAILHGDEFVHRSAAVQKYGLDFMNAINEGRIDPATLPHLAVGGSVQAALRQIQPPPKPIFDRGPQIKQMQPRPAPAPSPQPRAPQPQAPVVTPAPALPQSPAAAPPPAEQATPAPQQTPALPPPAVAGNTSGSGSVDYTLPWINTAIDSGAATLGSIAATAISMGAMAGAGAGGGPGAGVGGALASQMVQGLFQQGGKIVKGVANVISGAMVGSVPGSFMTTPEAYGRTQVSPPRELATAMPRVGGGITNYNVTGYDPHAIRREIETYQSIEQQSQFVNHPDRI
ncbi:hypothetical protein [Mycolicibacterium goodii]|uniref:hypothetical protein n=1 Tax=Mycolicibacterium goodii TaxID=134601 RepID=UPI001BDDC301|nr:hypothetical protein [Mycolicibacterium goodii]MBU8830827.1 hypothetical protein [Mycolicibacterium goodii]